MDCSKNKVKATALGEIRYIRHGTNATNNTNHVCHKILEEKEITFSFEETIKEDLKVEADLRLVLKDE